MTLLNRIPHWLYVLVSTFVGAFVGYLQDPANGGILALTSPHSAKPVIIGAVFAGLGTLLALAKDSWLKASGASVLLFAFIAPGIVACGLLGPAIPPAIDLAVCVADNAIRGESIAQIADACKSDVPAVLVALLASDKPGVKSTGAYGEATRARAAMFLVDGGP